MSSRRRRPAGPSRAKGVSLHLLAGTLAVLVLVPLLFGLLGGFKDNAQLATNPFGLPAPWHPENYTEVLASGSFWRQVANSVLIALATTVLVVGLSALAAFAFARFAFRGRELLFTVFTAGLMFPFAVAILPLFVLMRAFGLLDNPLGVVLVQAAFGLPMTIIILRGFFAGVPREVEEAAVIDGCTPFGVFWRILLPMARPALATVSVLAIVASWNNFFLPLAVFNDPDWWTVPLGVQQFQGQYSSDIARTLAYVVLAMVPALGFYAVAERHLISGLTAGATKG
ncbi:carbohydrate ABC transporter permease [Planomonospora venezuelensis]|uniref:Raffinose/stachyose/melibiose transport system permease protein n=1 Tax=Planomonospora venezuelensis TaxID=1999 RepID=A0A841DCX8_PLAVE|nr:carbohydrate ABC transporter permease [Planomonospora venezuelensis]MBB5966643.1 raffinose/stachyose/melibiose transport system permease protein [Planomonospora venezuelensis]GIN03504.1 sugar ABC transporter permease [Planomonospora venezuelensis]